MRVCVLTTSFPLQRGTAPGIHVLKKTQHLAKLGLDIDVLAPHYHNAARHEVIDGISVHRLQYMWPTQWQVLCYGAGVQANLRNSIWARLQLPLLVLVFFLYTVKIARKADIIHAHWTIAGLAGVLAGKLLRKPVVLMMHHAEVNMPGVSSLIKFVLEHVDYVLCNSSFTQSKVLELSRPKACDVIPVGVDIEQFRPNVDLSLFYEREPDIPLDRPLVLAFGRFVELKGFEHLIDAIALLNHSSAPYLMIGGHGPLKEQLQSRSCKKGIADRVKFLGYVPNEFTPMYYSAADVVVVPSIIDELGETEAMGLVPLEAFASQKPCIASNVGGIPDIVTDGVNGFLVEPKNPEALADKIMQLITNDRLRQEMGKQGRLLIEKKYSWPMRAAETLRVYQSVLAQRA